jgi:hypothetical protein
MKLKHITILFISLLINACASSNEKYNENSSSDKDESYNKSDYTEDENLNKSEGESYNNTYNENYSDENEGNGSPCNLDDGTYTATVDYRNSETGYTATYTLDVEVQDCQVVQINFPNDGYLDSDHISYADIDENGYAYVDGEDGKSYEVQIDN